MKPFRSPWEMPRLFAANKIFVGTYSKPSRPYSKISIKE